MLKANNMSNTSKQINNKESKIPLKTLTLSITNITPRKNPLKEYISR